MKTRKGLIAVLVPLLASGCAVTHTSDTPYKREVIRRDENLTGNLRLLVVQSPSADNPQVTVQFQKEVKVVEAIQSNFSRTSATRGPKDWGAPLGIAGGGAAASIFVGALLSIPTTDPTLTDAEQEEEDEENKERGNNIMLWGSVASAGLGLIYLLAEEWETSGSSPIEDKIERTTEERMEWHSVPGANVEYVIGAPSTDGSSDPVDLLGKEVVVTDSDGKATLALGAEYNQYALMGKPTLIVARHTPPTGAPLVERLSVDASAFRSRP